MADTDTHIEAHCIQLEKEFPTLHVVKVPLHGWFQQQSHALCIIYNSVYKHILNLK